MIFGSFYVSLLIVKHKIIIALGVLGIVFLVSVFFRIYQYQGGRYYIEMVDLVNRKTGEEKKKLKREIFSDYLSNLYGGINRELMGGLIL